METPWDLEERMWTEGADAFAAAMAPECVMAFGPVGILRNEAIPESLKDVPRWTAITMAERAEAAPTSDTMVLAYRADARRGGGETYRAWCTSSYVRIGGRWKIVQHQQSPIA